jgi:hypothetical protein
MHALGLSQSQLHVSMSNHHYQTDQICRNDGLCTQLQVHRCVQCVVPIIKGFVPGHQRQGG